MKFDLKVSSIKYIKVIYDDVENSTSVCRAIVRSINDREIIACAKYRENILLDAKYAYEVKFICDEGLYTAKLMLKSFEKEDPYIFFIFETPKTLKYEQNRAFFRMPVEYECTYKVKEDDELMEYQTKTIDISANGVSFLVYEPIPIQNATEIEILIDGKTVVSGIRYVRKEDYKDGYKASFAFTKLSEKDKDYISQKCFQKQLELRRRSIK